MTKILVRHGVSGANLAGDPAFGRPDAALLELGRENARELNTLLASRYDIEPANTAAATSKFLRTRETASEAGFTRTKTYSTLNEVVHGMELGKLKHMLKSERKIPAAALVQAQVILEQPPTEGIWFTHGLVILGLYGVLGLQRDPHERFVPNFCEVIELPI